MALGLALKSYRLARPEQRQASLVAKSNVDVLECGSSWLKVGFRPFHQRRGLADPMCANSSVDVLECGSRWGLAPVHVCVSKISVLVFECDIFCIL